MKKIILLLFLLPIFINAQSGNTNVRRAELGDSTSAIRGDMLTDADTTSLSNRIDINRDSINAHTSDINTLKAFDSAQSDSNSSYNSRINTNVDSINALSIFTQTTSGRVSVNEDSLADHTTQLNAIKAKNSAQDDSLVVHDGKINTNITGVATNLDSINNSIRPELNDLNLFKTNQRDTNVVIFDSLGTKSDSTNVVYSDGWSTPDGGVLFDGINDYAEIADDPSLDFGTNDFSIALCMTTPSTLPTTGFLVGKRGDATAASFDIQIVNTAIVTRIGSNSYTFNNVLSADTEYHLLLSYDRDGVVTLYKNGELSGSVDISGSSGSDLTNVYNLMLFARYAGNYVGGEARDIRIFNRSLSFSEYLTTFNQGRSWEYITPYEYQGANNTVLINGEVLTIGKNYRILNQASPTTDFTSYGATDNNYGTEFILSAALTLSANDSLSTAGEVAHYSPASVNDNVWYDQSGNDLDATLSGSPVVLNTKDVVTKGRIISGNGADIANRQILVHGNSQVNGNSYTSGQDVADEQKATSSFIFPVNTDDVTNPPTDAELDSIFGLPSANVGKMYYIDDNNLDTTIWLIWSNGTSWFYQLLTKAL